MRIESVSYEVYKYNELSEQAKEVVKKWYLENQPADFFTEDCKQDLENLFGKNDLDVQYSLGYCQGDGFNIYGEIEAWKIFKCLEEHNGGSQLEKFENILTEKEKKIILDYAENCGKIKLLYNNHYCYSLADYIDIVDEWEWYLEKDYNKELLEKFESMVRDIFSELCNYYEEQGYNYFYKISDEDLEEACESNDWEFLTNGKLFNESSLLML